METVSTESATHQGQIIDHPIPERMVHLAGAIMPSFHRNDLEDLLRIQVFPSRLRAARFCAETVVGLIAAAIKAAFSGTLILGEVCFLLFPIVVRDPHVPLLPAAIVVALTLALFRFRDAYSYPAAGSPAEIVKDAGLSLLLLASLELVFASMLPSFTLSFGIAIQAAAGAILAAQSRAIYHREDPPGEIRRHFLKRKIATVHMNLLLFAASAPLSATNAIAVPGGPLRDFLMGSVTPLMMGLAWRLKKEHWTYVVDRQPLRLFGDLELREMERQLALLPVPEGVGRFGAHFYAEVGFFVGLAAMPLLAVWRWLSSSPLAARTDWLQVGINFVAIALLSALWVQIKKLNYKLAADLRKSIADRKKKLHDEEEARSPGTA
jgi:hypothetical protein